MRISILAVVLLAFGSTSAVADSQRPSTVSNVSASALSADSIRVSWNEPWDNVAVTGYNVYRNNAYLTTVFNTTNYLDRGVGSNNRYEYSIVAFDQARNYSESSSKAGVSTQSNSSVAAAPALSASNGAPGTPSGLRAEAQGSNQARLYWNAAGGSVSGYNIYRDGNYHATVRNSTQYTAGSLNSNQQYRFSVVAFNGNQFSGKSGEISVTAGAGSSSAQTVSSSVNNTASSGSVPNGYSMVFNDEFREYSLNGSKWNSQYRWGPYWTINNEEQFYVNTLSDPGFGHSPFEFDGEHMTIAATRTPDNLRSKANNKPYLSGALTTYRKFKMKYGYVEMRAKLPRGKGLWSAFWLLHDGESGIRPEIDVVELIGDKPDIAYQTYHYYDNWTLRSTPSYEARGSDYSQDFHTYGMKWEPGLITWYVDGRATNTYSSGSVSNEDMYLLVNLALGGAWAGSPDGSTPFPARFTIDYIRAYQKN